MRILIALTYFRPHYSGLTIYAEREARALAARGHHVTILTSRFDPSLPEYEQHEGIEIYRMNVRAHVSKGVIMPGMPFMSWRQIKRADLVHLHVPQLDAALIAILAKILRKPVILTYHCDLLLPPGVLNRAANLVSDVANHITARLADVIVTNTHDYAENSAFLSKYLGKLQAIYPPIELAAVQPGDLANFRQKYNLLDGQRIIGMAARLAAEKGVEYLVGAIPLILEQVPQARVLFVGPYQHVFGEEEYSANLKPLIESVSNHWTFLGVIPPLEMSAFFHSCEVTVLPSVNSTESYGMVQVESMKCGTPVVASNIPGVRVPVRETGTGLIVPPRDSRALAEAIIAILNHPDDFQGKPEALLFQSCLRISQLTTKAYSSAWQQPYTPDDPRKLPIAPARRRSKISNSI